MTANSSRFFGVFVGVIVFACLGAERRLDAAGEVNAVEAKRMILGKLGDVTVASALVTTPAANAKGQVIFALQVTEMKGKRVEPIEVVVYRQGTKMAPLMQTQAPVPGHPTRVPQAVLSVQIAEDGAALIETDLLGADGRRLRPNDRKSALWLYQGGKFHLLLVRDEPIGQGAQALVAQAWHAALGADGRVVARVAHGTTTVRSDLHTLVCFHRGAVSHIDREVLTSSKATGVRYTMIDAKGPHAVALRELIPSKGLPTWELCNVSDGKPMVFARDGDPAPAGVAAQEGRPAKIIGPVSQVQVTANGRVLLASRLGDPKAASLRHGLLLTAPHWGAWSKVVDSIDQAPDGRPFKNLTFEGGKMAASDDGHVIFADQENTAHLYLADPTGQIVKIGDSDALMGEEARSIYSFSIASQGLCLIELLGRRSIAPSAFTFDPKRKLRPLFTEGKSPAMYARGKARLGKPLRGDPFTPPMSATGHYTFIWLPTNGDTGGGLGVIDLTR